MPLQWLPVLGIAVLLGLWGFYLPVHDLRLMIWSAAAATGLSAAALILRDQILHAASRRAVENLRLLVEEDIAPCFGIDDQGQVLFRNPAAAARFGRSGSDRLLGVLGDYFAQPSAVLYRLQGRALRRGHAREDVITRRGHLRLSVHRSAQNCFLWRLDEFHERGPQARGVDGVSLPLVVAGASGAVLFVNEAMRRLLGGRPRRLDRIFTELPVRSGKVAVVSGVDGPVHAVVARIEGAAGRHEIYLLPLDVMPRSEVLRGVEELPVALLHLQSDGALRAANREARALLRLDQGDRGNLSDLLEGLGRPLRDWIADVAAGRLPGKTEILRLCGHGEEVFVQVALRRLPGEDAGLLGVISDATAMKTLEAQFVQSQKMQAIGQLAGGVAHDFNNLLTAISGHCDLLLLRHDSDDPDYGDLAQIHQNANRAAALVGQLLAFSRKQTLKPELIRLADVLADVTHLLKRLVGERVRLDFVPVDLPGPIRADRRQLEQVLMNLVVNARDAMPDGGAIRIEAIPSRLQSDLHRDRAVVPAGSYALLRVTDQGCGIAPELLDKVFEPFFTTKRLGEGTGLGLPTAYGIVKQSGGFIFVDSEPGKGTVFSLYFPIHPEEEIAVPPQEPPPRRRPGRVGQGVVLLVEDEAPVRAFASRALQLRGYTVVEAANAEAALEILSDQTLAVDLFVSDVIMPGLDGPSWVRQARESRPNVRVIFVSGYAEENFSDIQEDIPNSVFLPKPFSLDALIRSVQEQMAQ